MEGKCGRIGIRDWRPPARRPRVRAKRCPARAPHRRRSSCRGARATFGDGLHVARSARRSAPGNTASARPFGARDSASSRSPARISPVSGSTSANTISAPHRCGADAVARKVIAGTMTVRACAEPERARRHVQRRGAVGAGDGVLCAHRFGEPGLERRDQRAGGQKVAAQRLGDGGDVVVFDELAAIGQERFLPRRGLGGTVCAVRSRNRIASAAPEARARPAARGWCRWNTRSLRPPAWRRG